MCRRPAGNRQGVVSLHETGSRQALKRFNAIGNLSNAAAQATWRARSSIVSARSLAMARSFTVGSRPKGTATAT